MFFPAASSLIAAKTANNTKRIAANMGKSDVSVMLGSFVYFSEAVIARQFLLIRTQILHSFALTPSAAAPVHWTDPQTTGET